jgi:hypothetical protein
LGPPLLSLRLPPRKQLCLYSLLKNLIYNAGLHSRLQVALVNLDNLIKPSSADNHPIMNGQGATAQTSTRSAGRHGNVMFIAEPYNLTYLFSVSRAHDYIWGKV